MSEMVLEFVDVSVEAQPPYDVGLAGATFSLGAGGLLLLRAEAGKTVLPVADAAEGLLDPAAGDVRFLGESWKTVHRDKAPGLRGRIGRVFDESGWVSNLDVDENVTLSQRYHTRRPEPEIYEESRRLAQALGLPELPQGRPAFVPRAELRRAEWVRAFMGDPALMIFERPARDLPPAWAGPLYAQIQKARERGAAVLWIAGDQDEVDEVALKPTLIFRMQGAMMKPDIG